MTGEWRQARCEASSCAQWRTLPDQAIELRSTRRPDVVVTLDADEIPPALRTVLDDLAE